MYKQTETSNEIFLESAAIMKPVATLQDEYGGVAHIIIDDHCYVLCIEQGNGSCYKSPYIFKEAFEVMKKLPSPA